MDIRHEAEAWGFVNPFNERSVRAKMVFDDMVFSDGTGEPGTIEVTLNLFVQGGYEAFRQSGSGEFCFATFQVWSHTVVQGQWTPASADNSGASTGMFAGIVADELSSVFTTASFSVAKNEPVTIDVSARLHVNASLGFVDPGVLARSTVDFRTGDNRISFPSAGPVFNVPAGYTVNSVQANVVNNEWQGNLATSVASSGPAPGVWLGPNAPNPFHPETRIAFSLPDARAVRLDVYDIDGRLVANLLDGSVPAGDHAVSWDGTDRNRRRVSSGVYLYRLRAGDFTQTRTMILVQ
jgi:hypothetical protein